MAPLLINNLSLSGYLLVENALRLRIKELQDFRKLGIRNMTDADKWVRENTLRVGLLVTISL